MFKPRIGSRRIFIGAERIKADSLFSPCLAAQRNGHRSGWNVQTGRSADAASAPYLTCAALVQRGTVRRRQIQGNSGRASWSAAALARQSAAPARRRLPLWNGCAGESGGGAPQGQN